MKRGEVMDETTIVTAADALNNGACFDGVVKVVDRLGGRIALTVAEAREVLDAEGLRYLLLDGYGGIS